MKSIAMLRLAVVSLLAVVAIAQCRVAGRLVYCASDCCVSCVNVNCDDASLNCVACFTACNDGTGSWSGCGF